MGLPHMSYSRVAKDFIDDAALESLIATTKEDSVAVREAIAKSLEKKPLTVPEVAALLAAEDPALLEEIFNAARELKRTVYGNRIVLFAPLYIGSRCVNDCAYCGFKVSNREAIRQEITGPVLKKQVEALTDQGHKRLILVFGEHPDYDPTFLAEAVKSVYAAKRPGGREIRRVNINAAPLDVEGYKIVKEAHIGTYQIFHETYHHAAYARVHPPRTRKGDYAWRLDGLNRAFEAGIDDLGIGALFGLADWRFEVLGLVSHAAFLQSVHGVGPHTISFPRLQPAQGVNIDSRWLVSDAQFKRAVAILRLAVPYTGMILTARENAKIRNDLLGFGVSQIDAGSRIDLGGYADCGDAYNRQQIKAKAQFELGDNRSLDEIIGWLAEHGYIPSFCTGCYRAGRTGEVFMEYAIPGFIQRLCTPNALTTFKEYLVEFASPQTIAHGKKLIEQELAQMAPEQRAKVETRLAAIQGGERDLFW